MKDQLSPRLIDRFPPEVQQFISLVLVTIMIAGCGSAAAPPSTEGDGVPGETPIGLQDTSPSGPRRMIPHHGGRTNEWEQFQPPRVVSSETHEDYYVTTYSYRGVDYIFQYTLGPGESTRIIIVVDGTLKLAIENGEFGVVRYILPDPQVEE